ncbi:MFS transporter [Paenibacillus sp. FSL R7-0273]|uniref:MFS transporter n=1 Tax=Paenibacillus sp. FSL R7-0273 TaxID=1536772 RepID=UPI0004F7191B|nr:MFS transporter [Paenibacillus sp. FSL R7-0273]AIQ49203.1 MFS transporter [Paenibacillus sp. FSL R7-0273]OMF87774.1 MFS transporter [Paenibacillus sp. FSL R7-0273]
MKTALWLYLFLFLAFFDLHAQYPILTPFAMSLGAGPAFIGWMMGMYSLTHLPGNLLAGVLVDKNGSRRYIVFSLVAAGILLLLQAYAQLPWHLLVLRAASGFALAFLSPACMTLLASLSSDSTTQGKYMSGHGIIHTLASVVSPAAGAYIVHKAGYSGTFTTLGWLLIATGLMALISVPKHAPARALASQPQPQSEPASLKPALPSGKQAGTSRRYYLLPFFVSCSQGVLFFELPLSQGQDGMVSTGVLLSLMSLGALATLCLMFLNRVSPSGRIAAALLAMALCFFTLAAFTTVPAGVVLFLLGAAKGVLFPAMASLFISLGSGGRLGRTFSLQSIAMSLGAFAGPVAAGQLRGHVSPYFIAFVLLMTAILLLPPRSISRPSVYHPGLNNPAA